MKRVLFVDHVNRAPGGAEVNLIELVTELRHSEHLQLSVACPEGSPLYESLSGLGPRIYDFGHDDRLNQLRFAAGSFPWMRLLSGLRALDDSAKNLRKIIREARADIVVSCTNKDHFAAVKACEGTQTRAVWWVNDLITKDFFLWPARVGFRKYSARADRLIAVSNCVADALKSLAIPAEKIRTIPNGIPLEKYQRAESGVFRQQNNLPTNEPLFGVIGRFCEWKGQDLFVQTAGRWIHARRPGHFVLVGEALKEDHAFVGKLQNYIRKHSLEQRVHLIPFQRNVNEALTDLDVLVHTSKRPEPFGRVIIEAMAIGTPVVAANAGGAREIITHNENGLLARPNDPEDYVTKLREAWPLTATTQKWIANARKTVEERFSLPRVVRDFEDLLQQIH
jgi:glycosyltransferase involved in cell wall biosynthesis